MNDRAHSVRATPRDELPLVACGAVAGGAALLAGAEPTGWALADAGLVVAAVVLVCAAAGRAPWWMLAALAAVAVAIAGDIVVGGVAIVAFAIAFASSTNRFKHPVVRSLSAGVAVNAMLWSTTDVFFGFTAICAITAATIVTVTGIAARPTPMRRRCWITAGIGFAVCLLAAVGAGLGANSARADITAGNSWARRAIDELAGGDYEAAATSFERAADLFDRSAVKVAGPLTSGGRLIPGLAQNLTAGRELARAAADTADGAASALRRIDPSRLTLNSGDFDLDELDAAHVEMLRVREVVDALATTVDEVASPWLVDPVRRRLADLDAEIDENLPNVDRAVTALGLAPQMLGGDEPRHYLVLFTTPAEARGLGGFSGNYAEIVIDDGAVDVAAFGRSGELNDRLATAQASCRDCPQEFLDAYGTYGFDSGPGGRVGPLVWLNITMSPSFPAVAETAANLYQEAGGDDIDGVVVLDPYVIAELMRDTGPIEVPDLGVTVAADDVVEFLLVDQYVIGQEQETRVEALDTLGRTAITRILESSLPSPIDLAERFGPLVEERRLILWSRSAAEQDLLADIDLLGALPKLDPQDGGFAVTVTNATGNKIDSFLSRDVTVSERTLPDGDRQLVAEVTLTNRAPTTGFPPYVIGNQLGLPIGTNRMLVTLYGPSDVEDVTRDGEAIGVERFAEAGWFGHRSAVDIPAGRSVTFSAVFALDGPSDGVFSPAGWEQPLRR